MENKVQEALEKVKKEIQILAEDAGIWDKNYWEQIDGFDELIQVVEDYEVYKKAFEIKYDCLSYITPKEDLDKLKQKELDQARKKLPNEHIKG